MIEILLQAERSLTVGQLDAAERLYWQAIENDPRNSIAVVGLARVALDRGDDRTAYQFARKALEIDGENAAAQRLVSRLGEVMRYRGEHVPTEPTSSLPLRPTGRSTGPTGSPLASSGAAASTSGAAPSSGAVAPKASSAPRASSSPRALSAPKRRGLIGRILGR